MPSAPVDLNALVQARTVTLDGQPVAVQPITARALGIIRRPGDEFDKLVTVAGLCAPSLSKDQILDLTPKQLSAILAAAQEAVEEVKASAPNGDAPTTTDTPTSSPA